MFMLTHTEPPCIPLKDDSECRNTCDPYDIMGTFVSSSWPQFSASSGIPSFPALPPLVYRRIFTTGGMGTMDMYESSASMPSTSSRPTSTRHITPFKGEVSARGSGWCAESGMGLSTARSSSMSINSPASNAWVMATVHSSRNAVDDLFGRRSRFPLRFQRGKVLGSGGSGTVYQAILCDGSLAAVKKMKLETNAGGIDKEIRVLSSLPPHSHCVRYLGSMHSHQHYYIIMEYLSGGSIQSLRSSVGRFKEAVMQRYTKMVLMGLQHLHNHEIIHRDIKGANVLLDEKGSAKIADFGCCKILNQPSHTLGGGGTPLWMAPEVCRGEPATAKSDVWAVGCLCLEMTNDSGLPWDFPSKINIQGIAYAIASASQSPEIPSHLSPLAQNFIRCCLQVDPDDRMTVEELLQHPFFSQDYAVLDSTEEDLLISQEESTDLNSSHSKIRCSQVSNFDQSENSRNLKSVKSPSPSPNSTRITKCRGFQDEEFHFDIASDDDSDEPEGRTDIDNNENFSDDVYSIDTLFCGQNTEVKKSFVQDQGGSFVQDECSLNSQFADAYCQEKNNASLSCHGNVALQPHTPNLTLTATIMPTLPTSDACSTRVISHPVSPRCGSVSSCGDRTKTETPFEAPIAFSVGSIVWESGGSDNVEVVKHPKRETKVRSSRIKFRKRTLHIREGMGLLLKWFSK